MGLNLEWQGTMPPEEISTPPTMMILIVVDPVAGGTTSHGRDETAEAIADYIHGLGLQEQIPVWDRKWSSLKAGLRSGL